MLSDWNLLSDDLQLALSREALRRASQTLACQARQLAEEIEQGALVDRGGPDALRLLATVVLITNDPGLAGNA